MFDIIDRRRYLSTNNKIPEKKYFEQKVNVFCWFNL